MTICLAIRCQAKENEEEKERLLFATDTQETSGFLKRPTTKCKTVYGRAPKKYKNKWGILIASSGDALVIDEVTEDLTFFLKREIKPDTDYPSIQLSLIRKKIGNMAYETYKKYKDRDISDPQFELLLGACDKYTTILYVTYEGKNQELDNFKLIGSGRIIGGELLLHEFYREKMNEEEAARLAAFIITRIGHIDPYVGGEPYIRICQDRTVYSYTEPAYKQIITNSESRWDLIKKAWWKMQDNATIKKRIADAIE